MPRVTDALGKPVSGVVHTAVNAIVSDHDDPEGLGRVKVVYPTLEGSPESHWLRVVAPGASDGAGLYALPSVGDEVLVVFLYGSQDAGVVVGPLWNGQNKPPAEADGGMPSPSSTQVSGAKGSTATPTAGSGSDAGNDRMVWRSRSGAMVVLDGTSGADSVQLWDGSHALSIVLDGGGSRIFVSNTAGDTHLRTSGKLFLESGGDTVWNVGGKLELKVGGDLEVTVGGNASTTAAADWEVTAGASATITAGASLTVESGGTLSLTGVTAKLEGSGTASVTAGAMVEVRAGLVKIN